MLFQKKCSILVKSALFTEFPLQNQQNSAVIVYVSGQRGREGDFYPKYQKFWGKSTILVEKLVLVGFLWFYAAPPDSIWPHLKSTQNTAIVMRNHRGTTSFWGGNHVMWWKWHIFTKKCTFSRKTYFFRKCRILVKFALFTELPLQNQQNSAVIVYVSGQQGREGDLYPTCQDFRGKSTKIVDFPLNFWHFR